MCREGEREDPRNPPSWIAMFRDGVRRFHSHPGEDDGGRCKGYDLPPPQRIRGDKGDGTLHVGAAPPPISTSISLPGRRPCSVPLPRFITFAGSKAVDHRGKRTARLTPGWANNLGGNKVETFRKPVLPNSLGKTWWPRKLPFGKGFNSSKGRGTKGYWILGFPGKTPQWGFPWIPFGSQTRVVGPLGPPGFSQKAFPGKNIFPISGGLDFSQFP